MSPGDFVRGKQGSRKGTALTGVIVRESERTNVWGEDVYQWWWILCEGKLIEELESLIELMPTDEVQVTDQVRYGESHE